MCVLPSCGSGGLHIWIVLVVFFFNCTASTLYSGETPLCIQLMVRRLNPDALEEASLRLEPQSRLPRKNKTMGGKNKQRNRSSVSHSESADCESPIPLRGWGGVGGVHLWLPLPDSHSLCASQQKRKDSFAPSPHKTSTQHVSDKKKRSHEGGK